MGKLWQSLLRWLRSRTVGRTAVFGQQPKPLREVVVDIETTALHPSQGKIVCIGLLLVEGETTVEKVVAGPNETLLLCEFWDSIRPGDYFIGHNIILFDLPFLISRSRITGVTATRRLRIRPQSTAVAYDTMQVDSGWGKVRWRKLGDLAREYGLPGKKGSGKGVHRLARERRWQEIEKYCLGDLRVTWDVYRHMKNQRP